MQGGNSGGGSAASSSDGPFPQELADPEAQKQDPEAKGGRRAACDDTCRGPSREEAGRGGSQGWRPSAVRSPSSIVNKLNAQKAAATMEDAVQKRKDLAEDLDLDAAESHEAMKKPASKNVAKTIGKPMKKPAQAAVAGKWKVEVRTRKAGSSKGQTDTYYHAPNGKVYRILGDAVRAGYRA